MVAFGAEAPAISRWALDGSGLVAKHIAAGHVVFDGYDFNNGSTMLVAERDPTANTDTDFFKFALWDPAADREIKTIDFRGEGGQGVGWAGRGALVGYVAADDRVEWYDVATGSSVDGVVIPTSCHHLWASAGGTRVYCGFDNGEPLAGPGISGVSLDGVLVGARAGKITRYDLNTLRQIAELPGARGEINTLQFSDDGVILLATSNDQTVSVYDVATGIRLGDPISVSSPLIYPGFLRYDGKALAVTDRTGVVVWDIDPKHLREAACRLAGRNLSTTEWNAYLSQIGPYRPTCSTFDS